MRLACIWAALAAACAVAPAAAADLTPPLPPPAAAAESLLSPFYVHVGAGGIFLSESARITVAGQRQAGANISARAQFTPIAELGYNLTPNWAVSFTGGYPPLVKFSGAGTLKPFGTLGKATYGPTTFTGHYHFTGLGAFKPYIGGGVVAMIVFGNKDAAVSNVNLQPNLGLAAQVGAEYMVTDHLGVFVDVKKAYLRTTAKGYFGLAPLKAKATLDPLVLSSGIAYRF